MIIALDALAQLGEVHQRAGGDSCERVGARRIRPVTAVLRIRERVGHVTIHRSSHVANPR
jgi:hypothetical protein